MKRPLDVAPLPGAGLTRARIPAELVPTIVKELDFWSEIQLSRVCKAEYWAYVSQDWVTRAQKACTEPLLCMTTEAPEGATWSPRFVQYISRVHYLIVSRYQFCLYSFARYCELLQLRRYVESVALNPLAQRNYHPRDLCISFREKYHNYILEQWNRKERTYNTEISGVQESDEIETHKGDAVCYEPRRLISVTTWRNTLFPEFDKEEAIATMKGNTKKWASPTENEYYGMSDEAIWQKWEEDREQAARDGTFMHRQIELRYLGQPYVAELREMALFAAFERENVVGKLRPYRSEWMMWGELLKMVGSADILYEYASEPEDAGVAPRDPFTKKHLVMMDWKRSKKGLEKFNAYQGGTVFCTRTMGKANYIEFTIQLCLYKFILETYYNVVIDAMYLVVLHPDQAKYIMEPVYWHDDVMQSILAHRCAELWRAHCEAQTKM